MLATTALREGLTLFFINVIFERMQELQGWSFSEVLLMYGLLTTSRFLSTLVLDIPYPLVGYVRSGRLDILLIRPAAPLFQIIGETGFNTSGIGSIPVGIAIILYALSRPDVQPHLWWRSISRLSCSPAPCSLPVWSESSPAWRFASPV